MFSQAAVLPVTFTTVSAKRTEKGVAEINWQVNNETNIEKYTIEKSIDGNRFENIGIQTSLLNNGGNTSYSGKDNNAGNTNLMYRIKATSIGGMEQYSEVVKLAAVKGPEAITVYPNPVTDHLINISFSKEGTYNIKLYNNAGQNIFNKTAEINLATIESIQLPFTIAKGQYTLSIISADGGKTNINIQIK